MEQNISLQFHDHLRKGEMGVGLGEFVPNVSLTPKSITLETNEKLLMLMTDFICIMNTNVSNDPDVYQRSLLV